MNGNDAILFIRGESPVKDSKYDIMKHPDVGLTADGGAEPYRYGEDKTSIANLLLEEDVLVKCKDKEISAADYLFFTDDEFEELMNKRLEEIKNGEKKNEEPKKHYAD